VAIESFATQAIAVVACQLALAKVKVVAATAAAIQVAHLAATRELFTTTSQAWHQLRLQFQQQPKVTWFLPMLAIRLNQ